MPQAGGLPSLSRHADHIIHSIARVHRCAYYGENQAPLTQPGHQGRNNASHPPAAKDKTRQQDPRHIDFTTPRERASNSQRLPSNLYLLKVKRIGKNTFTTHTFLITDSNLVEKQAVANSSSIRLCRKGIPSNIVNEVAIIS